jgi:N-acyl-L-homoserine lactone synthetase
MDKVPSPLVTIRVAESSDIEAIQRCRYDVYSELGFIEPSMFPDGRESDNYDSYSVQVIATASTALRAVGTTRLVLSSGGELPIQDINHHGIDISQYGNTAEISRLCVRDNFRDGRISLGMYRVLFHIVDTKNIEAVFAIVDEDFFKVITAIGFPFVKIGEPKDHMGITIPCVCVIEEVMTSLHKSETANMLGITELFERPYPGKILM